MPLDPTVLLATLTSMRDGLQGLKGDISTRAPIALPAERSKYAIFLRGMPVGRSGGQIEFGPAQYEEMSVEAGRILTERLSAAVKVDAVSLRLAALNSDLSLLRTLAREERGRLDSQPGWPKIRKSLAELGANASVGDRRIKELEARLGSSTLNNVTKDFGSASALLWARFDRYRRYLLASVMGATLASVVADVRRSYSGRADASRASEAAGEALDRAWGRERELARALAAGDVTRSRKAAQQLSTVLPELRSRLVREAILLERLPLARRTDLTQDAVLVLGDALRAMLRAEALGRFSLAVTLGGTSNPLFVRWSGRAAKLSIRRPPVQVGARPADLVTRPRRERQATTVRGTVARKVTVPQRGASGPKLVDFYEITDGSGASITVVSPYFSLTSVGATRNSPTRITGPWSTDIKSLHLRPGTDRTLIADFPDIGLEVDRLQLTDSAKDDWWAWSTVEIRDCYDARPNSLDLSWGWTTNGGGNILRYGQWSPLA